MDELLARHKKEQRDLVATVTSLKKQASKKTRKAVNQKCSDMQTDLDARHKREVAELSGESVAEPEVEEFSPEQLLALIQGVKLDEPANGDTTAENAAEQPALASSEPPRRRNRAKERLARRQAQEDAVRAQAKEEAANLVDYRQIEIDLMERLLRNHNLQVHDIKPDGHCLFRSIQDQLQTRGMVESVSIEKLRQQAAEYIRTHADDFTPYLFDEQTMQIRDIAEYTAELENTAMWGSDMELLALSKVYGCRIEVFVAGSLPIIFNEEEAIGGTLKVAFYKHSYGLGEHYNSCRDGGNL